MPWQHPTHRTSETTASSPPPRWNTGSTVCRLSERHCTNFPFETRHEGWPATSMEWHSLRDMHTMFGDCGILHAAKTTMDITYPGFTASGKRQQRIQCQQVSCPNKSTRDNAQQHRDHERNASSQLNWSSPATVGVASAHTPRQ